MAQKIKVLLIMGPIIRGGAELQVYEIARHLERASFEPIICSASYKLSLGLNNELSNRSAQDLDLYRRFVELGVKVYELDPYPVYDPRGVRAIVQIIRREKIDLIHVNLVIWGQLAGLLTGIPTVPHVRSELAWPDIPRLAYWGNAVTHRWFKVIIAVSEAVKAQVVHRWGVPSENVQVVHSGIDLERFNPQSRQIVGKLRQNLGIKPEEEVVIRVANARSAKALDDFVELAALVCRQRANTRFVLLGDGALLPRLKAQAQTHNLGERLLFLGRRSDVPQLLAMANIFVSTSRQEASPGSMKEAMAMQLPVVATAVGGHPEIVSHGQSGYLTPPGDPQAMAERVIWLLDHPAEATLMGHQGRAIVAAKFTNCHMVDGVARAYVTAIGKN